MSAAEPELSAASSLLQQCSGHTNSFMKISETAIWKLTDAPERDMFIRLMQSEQMKLLVPSFTREVPLEHWRGREPDKDSVCVELGDLTAAFGECPCVMDIKIGVRTFLEDEVSNPKVREDLLKKMDKLDGTAATAEEREKGGITKLRYMQFRERMSTSSTLGYRVEGVHVARAISSRDSAGSGGPIPPHRMESEAMSKETLSKISTEAGVEEQLGRFISGNRALKAQYLERLKAMHASLASCALFSEHQFINTSLLFVHDARLQHCGVWMIDFSKARPSSQPLTHTKAWELGNQEDGYLWGLANLIRAWEGLL